MTPLIRELLPATLARRTAVLCLALVILTLVGHLLVIANPGFFSHDEWQKFDHVQERGYADFARAYGRVQAGPEFGFPVRPLGFLQQAASSVWMERAPVITHSVDVVLHAVVALVIFLGLQHLGSPVVLAWLSGLFFAMSPLTTMATGWMAASFDQWYVLFVAVVCWLTYRAMSFGISTSLMLGVLLAASGAILSKEAAIVLPGAVMLTALSAYLVHGRAALRFGVLLLVLAVVSLPLASYLVVRLPALANSVSGQAHVAYTPSFANVPKNLLHYFAYPFIPIAGEVSGVALVGAHWLWLAVGLHIALIAGVWRYWGWRFACVYLAAFVMFVAPVLSVPNTGAHYLYGSALPMSIAIGAIVWKARCGRQRGVLAAALLAVGVLFAHTQYIQWFLYQDGLCQSNFLSSLDTRLEMERERGTRLLQIVPVPGAPTHVGVRAVFGRERYAGKNGLAEVRIGEIATAPAGEGIVAANLTVACKVR